MLGPAARILVSNPAPSPKPQATEAPRLRGIEGRRSKRDSPSQGKLLGPLRAG